MDWKKVVFGSRAINLTRGSRHGSARMRVYKGRGKSSRVSVAWVKGLEGRSSVDREFMGSPQVGRFQTLDGYTRPREGGGWAERERERGSRLGQTGIYLLIWHASRPYSCWPLTLLRYDANKATPRFLYRQFRPLHRVL